MSIILKIATSVAAVLAFSYGAGQFMSKSIATEIEIDAPASAVWAMLTDQEGISEWNPFIKRLSGELVVGRQLKVSLQSNGKASMDFTPTVLVNDENRELRWIGHLGFKGIFDGEHHFILEEKENGKTIFKHGETFSGMLSWVLFSVIGKDTELGFIAMNKALKERVELKL